MPDHALDLKPGRKVVHHLSTTLPPGEKPSKEMRVVEEPVNNDGTSLGVVVEYDDAQGDIYVKCKCGWQGNNPYLTKKAARDAYDYHVDPQAFEDTRVDRT